MTKAVLCQHTLILVPNNTQQSPGNLTPENCLIKLCIPSSKWQTEVAHLPYISGHPEYKFLLYVLFLNITAGTTGLSSQFYCNFRAGKALLSLNVTFSFSLNKDGDLCVAHSHLCLHSWNEVIPALLSTLSGIPNHKPSTAIIWTHTGISHCSL